MHVSIWEVEENRLRKKYKKYKDLQIFKNIYYNTLYSIEIYKKINN